MAGTSGMAGSTAGDTGLVGTAGVMGTAGASGAGGMGTGGTMGTAGDTSSGADGAAGAGMGGSGGGTAGTGTPTMIMEVLGVGRTAIWRTRAAYLQGGLTFALQDVARPGKPKQYRTDEEAQVATLACSAPPAGAERWTVALLTEAARAHPAMHDISRETIRRLLKKTSSNPGAS